MTPEQRLAAIRKTIQTWMDKQGHDRCWYYPDLFREIANIVGVDVSTTPLLPPRPEFEEGCRRYQQEEYGPR
ncbi:MAG: hypothetical protein AB7L09_00575 [Nitrospira sp.]